MESQNRPEVADGERGRVYAGTGLSWAFVAFVVLAAAVILFIVQNTDRVRVDWAIWDFEASLAGVVLVAILAAVVLTSLVGLVWRSSRRRRLTEREHVRHLEEEVTSLRAGGDQEEGEPGAYPDAR